MKKEELMKKLEELELREFYIHMIDFWTYEDKKVLAEVEKEIKAIKAQLA